MTTFDPNDVVSYKDHAGAVVVAQVEYAYTDEGWDLVKMTTGEVVPADFVELL